MSLAHQRMAYGQPRGAHYRNGPPKIDQGYQGYQVRTGSDSSNAGSRGKVDESVV